MDCLNPVILKNGLAVPCGKCDICRSNNRNEWSIRMAIHLASCDRMPMFITLTYNDDNLPYYCNHWKDVNRHMSCTKDCFAFSLKCGGCYPTLLRDDVSKFLKAYKRKYGLTNEKFQYFGCGEYGENYRRPHYHLLFFGDDELYDSFFQDTELAQSRIAALWPYGFVHVGIAGFDGIHYCTKYCLKDDLEWLPDCVIKPFTIASNGIGMNFLKSDQCKKIKNQLEYCTRNAGEIFRNCPAVDFNEPDTINDAIVYLESILPRFQVILDDGRKVYLPRAIRRKLIGSFEYFKDSPYWFYNHLKQLYDSLKYYRENAAYDQTHDVNMSMVQLQTRLEKIKKRYLERKYNSKIKTL